MNIASMEKNTALFHSEYKTRVSVSNKTLVLNGVIPSDSGVYSVREKKTNEIISVCNVTVSVHHSSLQLKTNESVRLNLFTSVPVEVILTWTNSYDSEDVVICTVENHKPDCLPQYKTRVSVSDNTLVLNGVRPSDSGIYTVREKETNEIINVYNISVSGNDSGDSWLTLLIVLIPVSVVVVLLMVVFICLMRKYAFPVEIPVLLSSSLTVNPSDIECRYQSVFSH
ncbi:uncharacterized protein LOC115821708 [Chanos chanos]|uniref:Uncharacterized protein LOC115821708 n=1 Tax=Chanos chanos TaxID=29144 RepID=A0A6J2WDB8_CHACN|nr:uncharacterized protein LOC115821708 [Chanos chanos]